MWLIESKVAGTGVCFEVMFALSRKHDHFLALVNSQLGNQQKTKTQNSSSMHHFYAYKQLFLLFFKDANGYMKEHMFCS